MVEGYDITNSFICWTMTDIGRNVSSCSIRMRAESRRTFYFNISLQITKMVLLDHKLREISAV